MTTITNIHDENDAFVLSINLQQTLGGLGPLNNLKTRTSLTALSDSPTYLLSNSGP